MLRRSRLCIGASMGLGKRECGGVWAREREKVGEDVSLTQIAGFNLTLVKKN